MYISNVAKKVNWISVGQALRRQGLRVFSPLELRRLLGVSAVAAQFLVHRYAKAGVLVKLRNGLYGVADDLPSELAIANRLYAPSYLSFEFALAYHHLIPEHAYAVTSATTRATQTFTVASVAYEYHRLKRAAFTGYQPVRVGGDTILMATPEKALVDYLYFVDLRKAALNDRLAVRRVRWRGVEQYARLFERPSLAALVRRLR